LPFTLREEHRLRLFENRVLRGIFGPKREKVAGSWRRLHNEELHNLYASRMKDTRMHKKFWSEILKGREHSKKLCLEMRRDLRELGCESSDWINLSQDMEQWRALVNTVMNFRVP
jgi:hypothetical protein